MNSNNNIIKNTGFSKLEIIIKIKMVAKMSSNFTKRILIRLSLTKIITNKFQKIGITKFPNDCLCSVITFLNVWI